MIRIKEIQDALMHVVGWQQAYDPAKIIHQELTTTESGLTFQGAHPLVTLDNIRAIIPDDYYYQYPEWDDAADYKAGDIVRKDGGLYIVTADIETYTAQRLTFYETMPLDDVISYTVDKAGGTTEPRYTDGCLRLYRGTMYMDGGNTVGCVIRIEAASGYKITSITVGAAQKTTIRWRAYYNFDFTKPTPNIELSANEKFTLIGLPNGRVDIYCASPSGGNPFDLNYLKVEYRSVEPVKKLQKYDILNGYLTELTRNGIAQVVQTFLQMKGLQEESRPLLERRTFFDGAGRLTATETNAGRLVGFEIVPARSMGVTAKIERVGLQMTGGTGRVRLYLLHSSQVAPIRTFDVEFTKTQGGFQWFQLDDVYMPYMGSETDAGGAWFLCYNQNELPSGMQAINVSKDWSREPCGTCNMGSVEVWRELTRYFQISPFQHRAPLTFAEYPEMWDIAQTVYTNTRNYGLNVEVSVGCDLTDFIIEQRAIFATAIQRQVAAIVLREQAFNPNVRVNRNQSNASKMDIIYEVDGNTNGPRPNGLGYELKKAYEALSLNTRGIDRICLKCNNKGVSYGTVL